MRVQHHASGGTLHADTPRPHSGLQSNGHAALIAFRPTGAVTHTRSSALDSVVPAMGWAAPPSKQLPALARRGLVARSHVATRRGRSQAFRGWVPESRGLAIPANARNGYSSSRKNVAIAPDVVVATPSGQSLSMMPSGGYTSYSVT